MFPFFMNFVEFRHDIDIVKVLLKQETVTLCEIFLTWTMPANNIFRAGNYFSNPIFYRRECETFLTFY